MILCPDGELSDEDIWQAFQSKDAVTVMTVSRRGAQRSNNIAVVHLLEDQCPLRRIPCASSHIFLSWNVQSLASSQISKTMKSLWKKRKN